MNRKLVLIAALGFIAFNGFAQHYEYEVFSAKDSDLNYRILYPEDFNPSHQYPVILFLHGAGERGSDNEKQLIHGGDLFISTEFREDYPSVIIFPQCPEEDYWSNAKVDRRLNPIGLKFPKKGNPTHSMTLVLDLIDSIKSLDYSQDNQLYVGGLSMGGMGTYELLSRRPNLFAAAFAICGGGNSLNVPKYSDTALWVFHGTKDDIVKPEYSTEIVLAMQKAGGEVRYSLYPNANHNSWDSTFAEVELFPWLFSHKKENLE